MLLQQGRRAGLWGQREAVLPGTPRQHSGLSYTNALGANRCPPKSIRITKAEEQHSAAWEVRNKPVSLSRGKPQAAGVSNPT